MGELLVNKNIALAIFCLSVALFGCGGGGGGDDSGVPVTMTLTASTVSPTGVQLTWTGARNPTGVYAVAIDGKLIDDLFSFTTSITLSRLKPSTRYCFSIGNVLTVFNVVVEITERSNTACTETLADLSPTTPTNLSANAVSPARIDLSWNTATDDYGVVGYKLYRDTAAIVTTSGTTASDENLDPTTQYCYRVSAYDTLRNESEKSDQICATTPDDTTPPNVPNDLVAEAVSNSAIQLSWKTPPDDGVIRGYRLFRDGTFLQDTTNTKFTDTNVDSQVQYCYQAIAYDAAGNQSESSNDACITTGWTLTTVDSYGDVGKDNALALDVSGNVHIGYYDGTYVATNQLVDDLKYATNVSGDWAIEVIDSHADSRGDVAIAIGPGDSIHISYTRGYPYGLKYATTSFGSWTTEDIDTSVYAGDYSSIATDSFGKVHISYGLGELRYTTNTSGVWQSEIVDDSGTTVGYFNSIAIDSSDKMHISYYGQDNGDLKYATNASGLWVVDTVDSFGTVGWGTSIAVDSSNMVHISYSDPTNGDLKYATNASGLWKTQVVDSVGDVGRGSSVALDSSGHVHISYVDATNHDLRYTTYAYGTWEVFTIDNTAWVDGETSLGIDVAGKAHISYHDDTNLMYATNRQ